MRAREVQAKNLAEFLVRQAQRYNLPIIIHGKAYKPGVPYCIGSYSTLIGYYVKQAGHSIYYVDPLADDNTDVVREFNQPAVILMAHNRQVTYGYTGAQAADPEYFEIQSGSVVVDPWRTMKDKPGIKVIHYGNTRNN
jgi:UDPglucose 6-dehydrogenase